MATLTLPEVRASVAAMLHGQELKAFWTPTLVFAMRDARVDIQGVLLGRGIDLASVTGGDAYASVLERQTIYWAGQRNRDLLSADDAKALDAFDMRQQLLTTAWTVNGVVIQGGTTGVRQSSSGSWAWPTDGSSGRNPLLTNPVPSTCRDVPLPVY